MTAIEQFENARWRMIKEFRRWKRINGQLMRKHKGEWYPVTKEDEQEFREILYKIIGKMDRLLSVFYGEEPKFVDMRL